LGTRQSQQPNTRQPDLIARLRRNPFPGPFGPIEYFCKRKAHGFFFAKILSPKSRAGEGLRTGKAMPPQAAQFRWYQ
jgi:hypothetical protein